MPINKQQPSVIVRDAEGRPVHRLFMDSLADFNDLPDLNSICATNPRIGRAAPGSQVLCADPPASFVLRGDTNTWEDTAGLGLQLFAADTLL